MRALADRSPEGVIAAAGAVLWRPRPGGAAETVLVHRPRYGDWSLPKGKLDTGEHSLVAAVREVAEETGESVLVGRRGLQVRYDVADGPKRVDYWLMQACGGSFDADAEVDELRWVPLDEAAGLVSYEHDRAVLADAQREDVPRAPAVLLVRHGSAGSRSEWDGDDDLRPLDAKGVGQAERLAEVLAHFRPTAVWSVPRTRCTQTVEPLAAALGLEVQPMPELGESEFADDPAPGLAAVQDLLGRTGPGVTVVCSQGGAIPSLLEDLGVQPPAGRTSLPCAKGSVWAIGGRPGAMAADYYRDFTADPDAPAS